MATTDGIIEQLKEDLNELIEKADDELKDIVCNLNDEHNEEMEDLQFQYDDIKNTIILHCDKCILKNERPCISCCLYKFYVGDIHNEY